MRLDYREWFEQRPNVDFVYLTLCDLNGLLRGKRIPKKLFDETLGGKMRMPLSVLGVDIWGRDVHAGGLVFKSGDCDGLCLPTERGLISIDRPPATSALVPMWMCDDNHAPVETDPRGALHKVLQRYERYGLTPVCAVELEFYLYDPTGGKIRFPANADGPGRLRSNSVYGIDVLDAYSAFLDDVYAVCGDAGISVEAAVSESGCGQFEINLTHKADALRVADDAVYFKHIVKRAARRRGLAATFMAKPYGKQAGSGMHVHLSLLNIDQSNAFDDGSDNGSRTMLSAVAGMIDAMADSTLLFAPHYNSFRRLRVGQHAPVNVAWGYENRTASLRIPGGDSTARRIEHRVAGADANPYLLLATVLGAALVGIERKSKPPQPVEGNAYDSVVEQLPCDWGEAIRRFERSEILREFFSRSLIKTYAACKLQEFDHFATAVTPFEVNSYSEVL